MTETLTDKLANRIKDHFELGDHLREADRQVAEVLEQTHQALKKANIDDLGLLADGFQFLTDETRRLHRENQETLAEQEAALAHAQENRELWANWRVKAANDVVLMNELRDVWMTLDPDFLAHHLETIEDEPLLKAIEQLKETNPEKYDQMARLLGRGDETHE